MQGFGLKSGALASSISHDSHNVIAIGTCVLFVWTPGVPVNMTQLVFVVIGTVVVLGLGVILMKKAEKEHMTQAE